MKNRTQINVRLTQEEQKLLQTKANSMGISVSAYIRQCAFRQETTTGIYNPRFKKAVEDVCSLYPVREELQISDELKCKYAEGVGMLWQFLK